MNALQVYALLNKKIKGLSSGIKSTSVTGQTITFTMQDGSTQSITFPKPADGLPGENGISIVDVDVDGKNQVYVTLSNGDKILSGIIKTLQGERGIPGEEGKPGLNGKSAYELAALAGFVGTEEQWRESLKGDSSIIVENQDNIGDVYKLDVVNADGTSFTTPNLKGTGSGGGEYFDNPENTVATVGGLQSGANIYGKSTKEVLEAILYPYAKASIEFAIDPEDTVYDVTVDELSKVRIIANITKNSNDIAFIRFFVNDELVHTVTDGYVKGGQFDFNYEPENPIKTSTVFKVLVNDGQSNSEKIIEIKFVGKTYYGVLDDTTISPTADDVKSLNYILKDKNTYTYNNISMTGKKLCYAFPRDGFSPLVSIFDQNGFDYISSYTMTILEIDGLDYYVYLLKDAVTVENFKQIYK